MGALDDLAAAKAGTSTGSPLEALAAKRSGAAPADGNPFRAVAGRALGAAAKVISPVSKALNYQLDKTMEARFHGGSLDENRARLRKAIPGFSEGYDDPRLFGHGGAAQTGPGIPVHPGVTHFMRGLEDTALDTLNDPLTVETLGVSALPKTAAKVAGAGLKAMTDTPLGAMVYDFLHWGGPVAREKGAATVAKIRGAAGAGSNTGMRVQQHLVRRFDHIVNGAPMKHPKTGAKIAGVTLSDEEKVRVAKALNGEIPVTEAQPVKQYDLVRHQATAGPSEHSAERGGTYFSTGGEPHMGDTPAAWLNRGVLGGRNVVRESAAFRNPLHLDHGGHLPLQAIAKLRGKDYAARVARAVAARGEGDTHDLYAILKDAGLGEPSPLMGVVSEAERVANIGDDKTLLDRIASHFAQSAGHDAIIGGADSSGSREVFRVGAARPRPTNPNSLQQARETEGVIPTTDALTPREQSAYRQLRTLTETDFRLRTDAVRKVVVNQLTRDLSAEDKSTLVRALRSGVEPEIPGAGKRTRQMAEGTSRNQQARVTNEAQPLQGPGITQGQHQRFQQANTPPVSGPGAYTMPHVNQAALDSAKKLNALYHQIRLNIEKAMPRREDYMPWSHEAAAADAGGTEARTVNKLDRPDPRTFERPNLEITHAGQLGRGFTAMAANTGRQVERGIVHNALGALVDDPQVHKLFDETIKATGNVRTNAQKVKDAWLAMVGYPRAATVSLTPRHGANILDLLANTVGPSEAPKVLAETMALAAKLVRADEKTAAALTKEGRELGALSGSYTERKPFFQKFSSSTVGDLPGGNLAPKGLRDKHVLGPIAGKKIPVLGPWSRLNNKIVWAVDEAAKQTYAKLIVARGEAEGLQAGGLASARLVDYAHHSPLVEALRHVAPFGTFRGSIPGAVAGGIARNPMRAALLNRATGGTMYGDKPQSGSHGFQLQMPTADVGRIPAVGRGQGPKSKFFQSGIADYARSTLGQPPKAIANAVQDVTFGPGHWASYGQPWVPKRDKHGKLDLGFIIDSALAGVPEAQTILEQFGIGRFQAKGMGRDVLRQALGVEIK